jgi:hypothetical protein
LLLGNPWNQFDWIEGREKPIRQLNANEIGSLLDYFETQWAEVTVAPKLAKVNVWVIGLPINWKTGLPISPVAMLTRTFCGRRSCNTRERVKTGTGKSPWMSSR